MRKRRFSTNRTNGLILVWRYVYILLFMEFNKWINCRHVFQIMFFFFLIMGDLDRSLVMSRVFLVLLILQQVFPIWVHTWSSMLIKVQLVNSSFYPFAHTHTPHQYFCVCTGMLACTVFLAYSQWPDWHSSLVTIITNSYSTAMTLLLVKHCNNKKQREAPQCAAQNTWVYVPFLK
jgi:hypothetical protein